MDANRRFCEIWDACKRLQPATQGLEIGSGKFVLVPPGQVQLSGFRGRLQLTRGGPSVMLIADAQGVRLEARAPNEGFVPEVLTDRLELDLTDGFKVDGQPLKHQSVVANLV